MNLAPEEANVVTKQGHIRKVPVDRLQIGDHVLVRPGEFIPADGIVLTGETAVDEATLTGEAIPVSKAPGESVFNGTVNGKGSMTIEVTKLNADSLFQKMIRLVQEAKQDRPPAQQWIEKIEGPYVLTVLAVVALTFIIPYFFLDWNFQDTFYRAMVLLVVASPCAVVASIMPALLSAISTGARNGVLMKGGVYLEQLSKAKAIAFDKTGTVTNGSPAVTDVYLNETDEEQAMLTAVGAIEQQSNHPLAKAICHYITTTSKLELPLLDSIQDITGLGVKSEIRGEEWTIGNASLMKQTLAGPYPEHFLEMESSWKKAGKTIVYVAKSKKNLWAPLPSRIKFVLMRPMSCKN